MLAKLHDDASKGRGLPRLVCAFVLAVDVCCGVFAGNTMPAAHAANPTDGFQAGNIISDANFYGGTQMSAAEIQQFLNQKVPRCTIGDPGRAPGSAWRSTKIASHCLRDSHFDFAARPANAYCAGIAGGNNLSAAEIIAMVGRACSISPKVLLIMLEKEQSLISDDWPTERQFAFAMGYDCPDSGPNNSANCNSNAGGFPSQVYRAAWQLQVYKGNPLSFNYRAYQDNTILWHPNTGCGTSQVYIQNNATAALYIYTPYRPNEAALRAGWGTGDACSTYGNRNFYNFYKAWFGSPVIDPVPAQPSAEEIARAQEEERKKAEEEAKAKAAAEEQAKAEAEAKAKAEAEEKAKAEAEAKKAEEERKKAEEEAKAKAAAEEQAKAEAEEKAKAEAEAKAQEEAAAQAAQKDTETATGQTSSVKIAEEFAKTYALSKESLGAAQGPATVEAGVTVQRFANATLFFSKDSGVAVMQGELLAAYNAQGGPSGKLGAPLGVQSTENGTLRQSFTKGELFFSQAEGVRALTGKVWQGYKQFGGFAALGSPLGAETVTGDVREQRFASGVSLIWSSKTAPQPVQGALLELYQQGGAELYGAPLSVATALSKGTQQRFTKAELFDSKDFGSYAVNGAVLLVLNLNGGAARLGLPVGPQYRVPNGTLRQDFEKQSIEVLGSTGRVYLRQRGGGTTVDGIRPYGGTR